MIIVTGGAGFIGSYILAMLERAGFRDLVVCDWLGEDERWRNIAGRGLADVVKPEDLPGFLERNARHIRAIVHMGAISATTERNVDLIVERNIRATLDLWSWCTAERKRLIYASSAATYGNGECGFTDDPSPEAQAALRPMNAYGWSKHMVDRRVLDLAGRGLCPPQWAGLKFFNVFGPNEYHKGSMRSVCLQVFEAIARGEPARLFRSHRPDYEDGGQSRDFVWVGDCANVVLWLLRNPDVSGLFNCGSGEARSFLDLAKAVFAARGEAPRIEFIDTPASIRDSYQYYTCADMKRLRAAGYTPPATSLEDGVGDYVRRYLMQDNRYL